MLNRELYFQLKEVIAKEFRLHPSSIMVVGSGKLGFSLVEHKRYRPFGESSDIDVAILSPELFDKIWLDTYNYWLTGAYWPEQDKFKRYLFRGWLRPDKLPPERSFEAGSQWWNFFRELSSSGIFGPYKSSAGLYRSYNFLETYHEKCISQCQSELTGDQ